MTAEFFRIMAQRCRDLVARARDPEAKTQLRIWAEEFDAQAEALELQDERNREGHNRC